MCRMFSERARIPFRRPERRLPNGHCPKPPESDRTGPSAPIAAEGREAGRHERPRRGGCRDAGGLILFYINGFYYIFYFVVTLAMIIYKSQVFSYPDDFLAPDLALICIMAVLEALRLYLGSKGNLTEEEAPLGLSLVITVGSMILSVYFLTWQTYVLKADVIINTVLLFIYGLESVLQVLSIAAFVG
ncbi:transmembrane protein 80 isoform X1 [Lagopus muta]|uniref:transmembrane protein 80 isoform X1 n=1 Tax=Lagopus muta TaxID=64668 RepID=UPI0020A0051A|nr:transmembrane protein 80 isoform X1 [Lagopus muta]